MLYKDHEYKLTVGAIFHVNENAKIAEILEMLVGDDWIPLITDISATIDKNIKVVVDGEAPQQMVRLCFKDFETLEQIRAFRITALACNENDILNVARNTVETKFQKGEGKEYGVIIDLQFFTFQLEGESSAEMMARILPDFRKYETTLFMEYTKEEMAELDEYHFAEHKGKTYIPKNQALDIFNRQVPAVKKTINEMELTRWNYTDRTMTREVFPVLKSGNETRMQII